MFNKKSITISVAGKELIFETGKIARQANGAVTVRSGDTILLATACAAPKPSPDIDFFPLRVDYQEKFSAAGKSLGGFIKREGRPTEREVLMCRLIDRPLRPMFQDGYFNEVQVLAYVLSYDGVHAPDPLAICAASAALVISDIPLIKPIAAVRVGFIGNEFIVNPSVEEQKTSRLDLILAGTDDAILMIEGYADFLTEEQILAAIEEGHQAIRQICIALSDWQKVIGKQKTLFELKLPSKELLSQVDQMIGEKLREAFAIKEKEARESHVNELKESLLEALLPEGEESKHSKAGLMAAFKKVHAGHLREMILKTNRRSDGRTCEEIRPINIETGLLPRTHGSALFTRGETQALAVATLGSESMGQRYEDLEGDSSRRFYLQYSFPPFSVGEVGRIGSPGRREIGHGKLAERALSMTVPKQEAFPYVIRLESNITESNGSSSMASVCGGCLALMDAGVPIRHPIAGIAMGLILEGERYAILSDILGEEDFLGDMDFKLAGDATGITAFQLDIKVEGINPKIMKVALAQAKQGRLHILHKMLEVCPKPKAELSTYAPQIETIQIKPSKIGTVIGPGGKQIRAIVEETGAQIDIDDNGLVSISATSKESLEKAKKIVHDLTAEAEIGKTYMGRVVSVVEFGCFVELFPGKEGLCHISELAHTRVREVRDVVKEGDMIEVKVLDVNDRGQIKLSRKALLPPPQKVG
ncbi:MAG: polyribonucleotide nucleotidyltransferase, partial [Chlamydiales bacterium]